MPYKWPLCLFSHSDHTMNNAKQLRTPHQPFGDLLLVVRFLPTSLIPGPTFSHHLPSHLCPTHACLSAGLILPAPLECSSALHSATSMLICAISQYAVHPSVRTRMANTSDLPCSPTWLQSVLKLVTVQVTQVLCFLLSSASISAWP